jgi:hypothetical protein
VPLRLRRLAQAVAVIGLASAPLTGFAVSAHAGQAGAGRAMTTAAIIGVPPHAKPASSGALPRREPPPPDVPSNASLILGDVFTDGIMSAGLLACLLVPIIWYGSIIKRRDRRVALAAADRAQHNKLGARQRGMSGDPLLDYFDPPDAPVVAAGPQRAMRGSRYQPRPSLSGRSTLTPAFAPRPMLAAPQAAGHDESLADGESAAGRASAWSESGGWGEAPDAWSGSGASAGPETWAASDDWSAARDAPRHAEPAGSAGSRFAEPGHGQSRTLRHAPVSGAPPWEPARQPTSELPWAVLSGPAQGPSRRAGPGAGPSQAPPESIWDPRPASRSSAPRSLFDPSHQHEPVGSRADADPDPDHGQGQPPATDRRTDSDWRSLEGRRPGSGERPIYIWDPETSAERDGTIRLTRVYRE